VAGRHGAIVTLASMLTPCDVAIERNHRRGVRTRVPEAVVAAQWRRVRWPYDDEAPILEWTRHADE
jgi:hypothetical protein